MCHYFYYLSLFCFYAVLLNVLHLPLWSGCSIPYCLNQLLFSLGLLEGFHASYKILVIMNMSVFEFYGFIRNIDKYQWIF